MSDFSPLIQRVLCQLKETLTERLGDTLLEMRVFGSQARGTARPDSDLDVFVKVRQRTREIVSTIRDAAWDVGYEANLYSPISTLIMTSEHYEELLARERKIARDIAEEGIPV